MSLFGKILAVLNVLAVLGLGYFFLVDYAKRQHWTHAVLRHDLAIQGLPVTDSDKDREGHNLADRIPEQMLKDVFVGAGNPVRTQQEALEGAKAELLAKIEGSAPLSVANPLMPAQKIELRTKMQKLAWVERPLAITAARREGLDRLMTADDKDELAGLRGVFLPEGFEKDVQETDKQARPKAMLERVRKFEDDLEKMPTTKRREAITERLQVEFNQSYDYALARSAEPDKRHPLEESDKRRLIEESDKRRAIARLLFCRAELAADERTAAGQPRDLLNQPEYKRAWAVIGLEAAVREMDSEAINFDVIAQEISAEMGRDRSLFAQQHAALLTRIVASADELRERLEDLKREQERVQAHQEIVEVRKKQVGELELKLAARQQATRALLTQQAAMEKSLFKAQQAFRDAAADNHQLEREVRTLEKGR